LFKNIISEQSYKLLNIDNKISPLSIWRYAVNVHFCNFNKIHPILATFLVNNALFIGSHSAKFQVNLPKKKVVTATFVRSP